MRRITWILFAVLVLTFNQESFSQTFGVKAGLNLSNVVFKNNSADFNIKTGFHAGATVEFPLNRVFLFETGILISSRGYRESAKNQFLDLHEETDYTYLEVPMLAKAFFSIPTMTFYLQGGPYLGYGIYGKDKGSVNSNGDQSSWSKKINWGSNYPPDMFKRLDYGLIFGPGIQIKHVQISLSYGLGLANISSVNWLKIHNRVTEFSVGYKFLQKDGSTPSLL